MLILVADLDEAYRQIVEASMTNDQRVSVLTFVPLTVDSIAACCILDEILQKNHILNHFTIITGYSDLTRSIEKGVEDETLPPSIILINCGASISLFRKFQNALNSSTIYVVDSHRPVNFENLDNRLEQIKVFDDSLSIFDEVCGLPDSTLDEDNSIIIQGKRKTRSSSTQIIKKIIDPNSPESISYLQNERFSDPASIQFYMLASALNLTSLTILWYAILGLTEHFLLEHISNERYETLFNALQNEASRLTGGIELFTVLSDENDSEVVSPVNSVTVPISAQNYIQPCIDLRCNLMRHWTLSESMSASPFVVSRLKLWYHSGKERLQLFFAKMGVPLRDANTSYISMSADIRDSLISRFDQWCDRFGLTGIAFPSFVMKTGFLAPLAASDVVYGIRAKLVTKENKAGESFTKALSVLKNLNNPQLITEGVEEAKVRFKSIVSLGMELMNRKSTVILNVGPFRITYIHNAAERGFPLEPSILTELGQFLIQAFREEEDAVVPIVVAAFDQESQKWTIVAVSTGLEFGEVEASRFGSYFIQAAKNAEIEIVMDSFDSFVCQVPNDILLVFVDQLTLLAMKEVDVN
ncbi:cell division control protein 45 [Histomonas meleagridis]|uniref:cell division control protein 45-like n=1 Tax=Histomonas meleagridis TaxID=135588 RepID=UPI003559873D|nr:cell division control protein 45 [Histomonas meleagridis]KAH0805766.1 cell division control protein 45-like [Histomonas meleagridis]